MLMEEERTAIVRSGRTIAKTLTKGTAGNLSIICREKGLVAITPSGIPYDAMTPQDVVVVDVDGTIREGDRKPSSELGLHLAIYRKNETAGAIVHTHSLYCTVLSCLGEPIQAVHYVLASTGADSVPVVSYATYGTEELAEKVSEQMRVYRAVLMGNHGFVCCGEDLKEALSMAETCEWVAELQWKCMLAGRPKILPAEEIDRVKEKFRHYGQEQERSHGRHGYF